MWNLFTLIGLASVFLLFLVPMLWLLKIFSLLFRLNNRVIVFSICFSLIAFPVAYFLDLDVDISIISLFAFLSCIDADFL